MTDTPTPARPALDASELADRIERKALHYLHVDLKFLLGALKARDPADQIEARVRFLIKDVERALTPHAKKKGKANG